MTTINTHQGQPLVRTGRPLVEAEGALILLHGRGATAESILDLSGYLGSPKLAYLAPQAAHGVWYPYSFLAPLEQNEPQLSWALARVDEVVSEVEAAGIPAEHILLGGFSQGACLASEWAARHARRYGGLLLFSGGLIGPEGTARDYRGGFDGTPVLLGCSAVDPHIPLWRVEETADVLSRMGAVVDKRVYPRMGHTINQDEIDAGLSIVQAAV